MNIGIRKGASTLGEPLEAFNGVLQGEPTYSGEKSPLLGDRDK